MRKKPEDRFVQGTSNLEAAIYIFAIIAGTAASTLYLSDKGRKTSPLFRVMCVITLTFLAFTVSEFYMVHFASKDTADAVFHLLIAFSETAFFVIVACWVILLGIFSGNPYILKGRTMIIVTVCYGAFVEILTFLMKFQGGLFPGVSYEAFRDTILTADLLFDLFAAVTAARFAMFSLASMRGEKQKRTVLVFSLLLFCYMIWCMQFDYGVGRASEGNYHAFLELDPSILVYSAVCVIAIYIFFRHEYVRTGYFASDVLTKGVATDAAWQRIAGDYELTLREMEIVQLVYQGMSNPEVGNSLFIAENTVKRHLTSIFKKTKTGNRFALINLVTKHMGG